MKRGFLILLLKIPNLAKPEPNRKSVKTYRIEQLTEKRKRGDQKPRKKRGAIEKPYNKGKNQNIMKQQQIFFIALVILMICFGCKKDEEPILNDLATKASGAYTGTYTYICTPAPNIYEQATIEISRINDSTVLLSATIANEHRYDEYVKVTEGENGHIDLYVALYDNFLSGSIEGKELSYMLGWTNSFTGTKP